LTDLIGYGVAVIFLECEAERRPWAEKPSKPSDAAVKECQKFIRLELGGEFHKTYGLPSDPSHPKAGDVLVLPQGHHPGQTGGHVGIATGKVDTRGNVEMLSGGSWGVKHYRANFVAFRCIVRVDDG
jgi:hypothetical protein